MTHYTPVSELNPISQLFQLRERQMKNFISNLRIIDVCDDGYFKRLKDEVKRAILLKPIIFGNPEIAIQPVGNNSFFGKVVDRFRHLVRQVVCFPFTGSSTLFKYAPDVLLAADVEVEMFNPEDDCVVVDVHEPVQDAAEAIREASIMVRPTQQIIAANNTAVEAWARKIETLIETEFMAMAYRQV
jgi:hypothetical protein